MRKLILSALVALLLVGGLFAAVDAQAAYQVFENIRARTLTTLGNATIGADLTVTDDATITDDLSADGMTGATLNVTGNSTLEDVITSGYVAAQDDFYLISADPLTVTDGGTITPTRAMVELTAAGTVGAGLAPCGDGQLYIFLNTANQTITISDTGTTRLAGNAALGQWDSLTVIGSGVSCNEVTRANN